MVVLTLIVGPLLFAAVQVRRAWLSRWSGPIAILADAVLALGLVTVVAEILGTIGLFRRGALIGASVAVGIAAGVLGRGRATGTGTEAAPTPPRFGPWATGLSLLAVTAVSTQWVAWTIATYRQGIQDFDSLDHHLPVSAAFVRSGWLTRLLLNKPEPVTAFHPQGSELLHGLGMMAFHRDVLSPGLNLAFLALLLLAGWALGQKSGFGPLTMSGAAAVAAIPILAGTNGGTAINDIPALALLLASVALLANAEASLAAVATAGLAAGLAVGIKEVAFVPLLVLTVVVYAISAAHRWRATLAWAVAAVIGGFFWEFRNLVRVGSPFPTLHLKVGSVGFPSPSMPTIDRYDNRLIHYAFNHGVWRDVFIPGVRIAFRAGGEALLVVAVAGAIVALVVGPSFARGLAIAAAIAGFSYTVTPWAAFGVAGHPALGLFLANTRYGLAAVLLAVAAGAVAVIRLPRRWQEGTLVVFVALALVESVYTFRPARISYRLAGLFLVVVVLAGGAAVRYLTRVVRRVSGRQLVLAGVGTWLVIVLVSIPFTDMYNRHRYLVPVNPQQQLEVTLGKAVHGQRIGVVGLDHQYLLMGPTLANEAIYIGRKAAHGALFDITSCQQWRDAVNRGRFAYLVLGPPDFNVAAPAPPALRWTTGTGAVRLVGHGGNAWAFRLASSLDPRTCSA